MEGDGELRVSTLHTAASMIAMEVDMASDMSAGSEQWRTSRGQRAECSVWPSAVDVTVISAGRSDAESESERSTASDDWALVSTVAVSVQCVGQCGCTAIERLSLVASSSWYCPGRWCDCTHSEYHLRFCEQVSSAAVSSHVGPPQLTAPCSIRVSNEFQHTKFSLWLGQRGDKRSPNCCSAASVRSAVPAESIDAESYSW